jgi:S-adenosylmethionine:tRNA ribosyltransferase-isomerase
VGYGTFSPVRCSDIREHRMHGEYAELPRPTLEAVRKARAEGRPVIAVGTTSARLLEGVRELRPDLFERSLSGSGRQGAPEEGALAPPAFAGWIRSFLYPGRPIRVIDGLITNFHLPGSSLLMLVSAFAGRERVLDAYHAAIAGGFRFFSYGDAMLIL